MGIYSYLIIFVLLIISELIYISIARRFKIGNEVTPRSSHKEFKVSGGGIIFSISLILFHILYHGSVPNTYHIMLIGACILALISFYDDIKNSAPWFRLTLHIIVVALLFKQLMFNDYYDVFLLLLICGVGFINAFNFMDGINGILTGYTLVTLISLLYYSYHVPVIYIDFFQSFIIVLIIATVVFGFFNFRKNAVCFSGDVGSIVMGFFILYLVSEFILSTGNASIIIFLIVYAIDSVFTIFQRLFAGENIFQSHRLHLYQILANQCNITHYKIALFYSMIQLGINIGYLIISDELKWTYFIVITITLTILYFIIKRILNKVSK